MAVLLAGVGVVDRLITDLATFDFPPGGGMVLAELEDGVTLEQVRAHTEASFSAADGLAGGGSPDAMGASR